MGQIKNIKLHIVTDIKAHLQPELTQNPYWIPAINTSATTMAEQLSLRGTLKGHNGWVTQIATTPQDPNLILSASRDKTLILWELSRDDELNYGIPKKCLTGHNHFVSDVVMSSDGQFALSGSWDKTLRLWDLNAGITTRQFVGHTKDVLSVAFSADNRQIVEYTWSMQVHDSRRMSFRMGVQCPILSQHSESNHCVVRMGQNGESVELDQLQVEDEPLRTHRIREHDDDFTRWFALCIRW